MTGNEPLDIANRRDRPLVPVTVPVLVVMLGAFDADVKFRLEARNLAIETLYRMRIEVDVECVPVFDQLPCFAGNF